MQQQVAGEVKKRTATLATISHDLRTPLTALRIRGELVDDDETRRDVVASINKIDKVIAFGLEYLRGESRSETLRNVDLSTLLASVCSDFDESGQKNPRVGGSIPPLATNLFRVYSGHMVYTLFRTHS